MKKLMEHIDSLILNWGVEDGKLSSLEELYGVLIDKGWDHPSATAYLNNIHKVFLGEAPEDDTKPLTDKDKELLKQKGLAYIRGTKPAEYGKKNNKGEGEKPAVFVNVDGKLQKPDESEKDTDSKSKDKKVCSTIEETRQTRLSTLAYKTSFDFKRLTNSKASWNNKKFCSSY